MTNPKKGSRTGANASESTLRLLWVRAGGRCELKGCNKYLEGHKLTGLRDVSLGEGAHNVGASDDGPRGHSDLTPQQRADVDNLLLLCFDCHKTIDDKLTSGEFTTAQLRSYKFEHEARVKAATGIAPSNSSSVLRMLGKVRGNMVALEHNVLRSALLANTGRYPDYRSLEHELDIDLTALDEETPYYWETAKQLIARRVEKFLEPGLERGPVSHLSVFAFARIPLLAYLGYALGDKIPVDVFQKQRGEGDPWGWDPAAPIYEFETIEHQAGTATTVTVILSLSGAIAHDTIPEEYKLGSALYEIRPKGVEPNRDLFRHRSTYEAFRIHYQHFLRRVEKTASRITVVPAVPLSAAVTIGREVLRDVTPEVLILDKVGQTYIPTITLNV